MSGNNRFEPFPIIETRRLRLNRLCADDAHGIFALRSDENVIRYTSVKQYKSITEAEEYIERIEAWLSRGESIVWSISLAENSVFIGTICLWNLSGDGKSAEIGYDLLPAHHGNGYIREAVRAVLDCAFGPLGFERICADLCADNARSVNALVKSGFVFEREHTETWDGEPVQMAVYATLKP